MRGRNLMRTCHPSHSPTPWPMPPASPRANARKNRRRRGRRGGECLPKAAARPTSHSTQWFKKPARKHLGEDGNEFWKSDERPDLGNPGPCAVQCCHWHAVCLVSTFLQSLYSTSFLLSSISHIPSIRRFWRRKQSFALNTHMRGSRDSFISVMSNMNVPEKALNKPKKSLSFNVYRLKCELTAPLQTDSMHHMSFGII